MAITPALAADGDGRAVLAWSQRVDEQRAVVTAAWRRPDGSWSAPAPISDGQAYAFYPSIAVAGNELRVVWTEIRARSTSVRAAVVRPSE
ncbi:hypothetical protein D3C83_98380 [compost metagenome]